MSGKNLREWRRRQRVDQRSKTRDSRSRNLTTAMLEPTETNSIAKEGISRVEALEELQLHVYISQQDRQEYQEELTSLRYGI